MLQRPHAQIDRPPARARGARSRRRRRGHVRLEFRSKWAQEALTRENMSSWAHAGTPTPKAFVQFRADQAGSYAYKLRNSGDQAKGFVLLHRRWVVERSFAWLTKFRRLVRDYETLPATHEAMIWTAATCQLSNRLTR
jgi:transposase